MASVGGGLDQDPRCSRKQCTCAEMSAGGPWGDTKPPPAGEGQLRTLATRCELRGLKLTADAVSAGGEVAAVFLGELRLTGLGTVRGFRHPWGICPTDEGRPLYMQFVLVSHTSVKLGERHYFTFFSQPLCLG